MDSKFYEFIEAHHVLSLATVNSLGKPWVASCFYHYLKEDNIFIFSTDVETRHGADAILNSSVAANIVLETKKVGMIQGLQLEGELVQVELCESSLEKRVKREYMKAYPFTVLMKTSLWVLTPSTMKLTDNRLGFGKKLIWSRESE